jgi:hypothetical protein
MLTKATLNMLLSISLRALTCCAASPLSLPEVLKSDSLNHRALRLTFPGFLRLLLLARNHLVQLAQDHAVLGEDGRRRRA